MPVERPDLSVVIRSRDEAPRLALTLAALECQADGAEVVVVDDGSSDPTQDVLAGAAGRLPLVALRHPAALGRSAASNAGARQARGEVLLFLDGDTLPAPDLLARHRAAHARADDLVVRGEPMHLRCTRMLLDPDAGTAFPAHAETLARRPPAERERMRVTLAQVREAFDEVARRAESGIYPGADPRRLQALETQALRESPACSVLWAAASGHNQSVRRERFLRCGGFDERLDNNEHRELAYRLVRDGARMALAEGAHSYHLTHRSAWRDPVADHAWERHFLAAHPDPAVALLCVFWSGLANPARLEPRWRIASLPELERAARDAASTDFDEARARLGLERLGDGFWRPGASAVVAAGPGADARNPA